MRIGFLDFSVTFLTRIVVLVATMGAQSCLAWVLGPGGRGSYAVCLIFSVILTLVFLLGCESGCIYFVAAKQFTPSEGFVYACIYSVIGSSLAVIAGLIILQFPFEFLNKATIDEFYIAILSIPFGVFSTILVRLFIALKEISCFATISIVKAVAHLILVLVLVWLFNTGVEGALFGNILSDILVIILCLYYLRTRFQVRFVTPNLSKMKKIFYYGLRYYVGKVSNQANAQMGTMLMAFFSNAAEIGMFSVGMRMMTQIMIIPDSLNKVLQPRIASDPEGRKELVTRCFRLSCFFCGLLLLLIAILAHPLVMVLFSPAFLPAVPIIQVLAVGMTLRCGSKMMEPYLLGTNRPGTASLSVASGAVVNIVLLYLLLPRIGMMGAAIGVVGSHLISLLILCRAFLRHSGLGMQELFILRSSDLNQVGNSLKTMVKSMTQKS